ncbi:hypothetical protein [Bacteroides thetaiotaomicron]|uniref:hypothetical protein n=1 Tax=Bacteroides thetaiotaomicron TaxID=818 RepID=UPI0035AE5343
MLFLRYGNIVDGEIYFVRSKTSHTSNHKREIRAVLTPEMRDIIKRWETLTMGNPILSCSRNTRETEGLIRHFQYCQTGNAPLQHRFG